MTHCEYNNVDHGLTFSSEKGESGITIKQVKYGIIMNSCSNDFLANNHGTTKRGRKEEIEAKEM